MFQNLGNTLQAPARDASSVTTDHPAGRSAPDTIFHVLVALVAVVAVGRLVGRLFQYAGQPPVIGEVLGGILLGPSFLGALSPSIYQYILAPDVAPHLGVISQLGVILYMFLVGLELNLDIIRKRLHASIAISQASIVAPFVLGTALALYLYPRFATSDVPFTSFALFMGLAMSITAFPVLARILSDTKLIRTELGQIALTCASVDDVTAWCLLAFVVGVVQKGGENIFVIVSLAVLFTIFLFVVVRPVMVKLSNRRELSPGLIAFVLVLMLLSALTTEKIGIHAIFGAFLFGAIVPHDSKLAHGLTQRLQDLVTILLLPAFFAFTGMRTQIGLVSGVYEWLVCALIIVVATAGKFGGTLLGARASGIGWHQAAALGVLMNTRGLMELIVLNVGLELGVISPRLFTMLVLMAILTTIITTPVLRRLMPAH